MPRSGGGGAGSRAEGAGGPPPSSLALADAQLWLFVIRVQESMEERAQLAIVPLPQLLEPAAQGEQIGGDVRPAAQIEILERAATGEDCAPRLPKGALRRAGLQFSQGVLQSAGTGHADRFSPDVGIGISSSPRP